MKNIFLIISICLFQIAIAQNDSYLKTLPSIERINNAVSGASKIEKEAKQYAIYEKVVTIIDAIALNRSFPKTIEYTSAESNLITSYHNYYAKMNKAYLFDFSRVRTGNRDWERLTKKYASDGTFEREAFNTLIPNSTLSMFEQNWQQLKSKSMVRDEELRKERERKEKRDELFKALILLIIDFVVVFGSLFTLYKLNKLGHSLNKYEFENTTSGGVLQFKTYEDSIKHNRRRGLIHVFGSVAILTLIIGILHSIYAYTVWESIF